MNWLKRIWARIKRRRRINAAKTDKTPLREFIYLDEVSVYSLLTSRKGPLATEYTDTQQNAESSEVSGSLGGGSSVIKANTSSTLSSTQTRTTQVLRKSTIQAAFKELHEGEQEKLAISVVSQKSKIPDITTWSDLEKVVIELASDTQWVIDPDTLMRGRLFDLAIELAADEVYRITSMVEEVVNIVSDSPQLFPIVPFEVQKVASINRVLDALLVGLIPLKCRVTDYRAVQVGNKKYLIHNEVLTSLPAADRELIDVYVAGVTEQRLFWKDVRRVLFSGLQFRAMCRANGNGLQDSWVPVKLFDVLRDISPGLADGIDDMVRNVYNRQRIEQTANGSSVEKQAKDALLDYGLNLADQYGVGLDRGHLEDAVTEILHAGPDFDDPESRRKAFAEVTERVSAALGGVHIDSMVAAQIRSAVIIDRGIGPLGRPGSLESPNKTIGDGIGASPSLILDVEIVAIYWLSTESTADFISRAA